MDKDLLVIGGGINGVGVAADAAGRGLSVALCEMGDLASATSSASSKMIHGGLRYLENGEISLVRQSIRERSILMRIAPHLVRAKGFVMPHCPWLRPMWLLRAGLFMYDNLTFDRMVPASKKASAADLAKFGLKPEFKQAVEYFDCITDDSRLVVNVALLAKQHGAEIMPRTRLVKAIRKEDHWSVSLMQNNDLKVLNVKAIVNATGPWVMHVAENVLDLKPKNNLKWVKGSHIVVRKLFDQNKGLVLQNKDGRIVFVIPYYKDFTLIGTTDVLLDHIEQPVTVSDAEVDYLCEIVNQFMQQSISPKDIVHKFAGIRSLHADEETPASKMTREYILDIDERDIKTPAISIIGGKITTYRNLAEIVVNNLQRTFPNLGKPWTTKAYLPGGFFPNDDLAAFTQHILKTYAPLPPDLLIHYVNTYGTRAVEVLMNSHNLVDLGTHFGGKLYKREVDYLVQQEWAQTAEDILWRRGKQGLWFTPEQVQALENYLSQGK